MLYHKFILRHRIDTTRIRADINRNRVDTNHNGVDTTHNRVDASRNGYTAELSYQIGGTSPTDPEAVGMKSKISSKARFQLSAGMTNLGKTLFSFGRWKHKTNSANDSPWTNLMQITIA